MLVGIATTIAAGLIIFALQQNMHYLFTPSQIRAGQARGYRHLRLGGMVEAGSIKRYHHSLRVTFTVTDASDAIHVVYNGILPDLFRAGQAVIATGSLHGQRFVATEVLAKHDANYMPRELRTAITSEQISQLKNRSGKHTNDTTYAP